MNVGGLPGAIAICRAAKTMRGARGKIFEWGLMMSPRKTIHVILPQTLKCIQFFKHRSLYNLYTCFTSSFLGPFIGWGPSLVGAPCKLPPFPPLSAGLAICIEIKTTWARSIAAHILYMYMYVTNSICFRVCSLCPYQVMLDSSQFLG